MNEFPTADVLRQAAEQSTEQEKEPVIPRETLAKWKDQARMAFSYESKSLSPEQSQEFVEAKKAYMEALGQAYDQFVEKYGHARTDSVSSYIGSVRSFEDWIKDNEVNGEQFGVHYDLGQRFMIDCLMNDPNLKDEDRPAVHEYLLSLTPYAFDCVIPSRTKAQHYEDFAQALGDEEAAKRLDEYLCERQGYQHFLSRLCSYYSNNDGDRRESFEEEENAFPMGEFPVEIQEYLKMHRSDSLGNSVMYKHFKTNFDADDRRRRVFEKICKDIYDELGVELKPVMGTAVGD